MRPQFINLTAAVTVRLDWIDRFDVGPDDAATVTNLATGITVLLSKEEAARTRASLRGAPGFAEFTSPDDAALLVRASQVGMVQSNVVVPFNFGGLATALTVNGARGPVLIYVSECASTVVTRLMETLVDQIARGLTP